MSSFNGFNAAVSGMFAAQRNLDIIAHNISNQNTPGYSRQRALQKAAEPTRIDNRSWLGTGVEVGTITQVRDEMLDSKYRLQLGKRTYWEEVGLTLKRIEDLFQEPTGHGITNILDNFFKSVNTVTINPNDPTARTTFITNAKVFADNMNSLSRELELMVTDMDEDIDATVYKVNGLTKQIAELNKLIIDTETDGSVANDYRDSRNLLLDELAEYVDIRVGNTIYEDPKSNQKIVKMNVFVADKLLISNDKAIEIQIEKNHDHPLYTTSTENSIPKREDLANVKVRRILWNKAEEVDMNKLGGKLGAMVQMRDSYGDPYMDTDTKGISYYVRMLNEYTRAFCTAVNEINKKGFDAYGKPGEDIFVRENGSTGELSARNVTVNIDIIKDPQKLAVGTNPNESNANNFRELYLLKETKLELKIHQNIAGEERELILGGGTPEEIMKSQITAVLGVEAENANNTAKAQEIKAMEIDLERMSVSGVSENEEYVAMIKYKHAYNASARMISTMDEMLDVIINRMGRVGL